MSKRGPVGASGAGKVIIRNRLGDRKFRREAVWHLDRGALLA